MSFGTAYATKKRGKKMASGGKVGGAETSTTGNKTKTGGSNPGGASTGGAGTVTITTGKNPPKSINISNVGGKTDARNAGGMDPGDKGDDMKKMAHGGQVKDNHQSASAANHQNKFRDLDHVDEQRSGFVDHQGNDVKRNNAAVMEDDRRLNQHGKIEQGPQGGMYAEGGQITDNYQTEDRALDMVGKIMAQRQRMYSRGGQVANDTGTGQEADKLPNQYDDLVLRDDDMEDADYTGANSGDELGNDAMDERDSDVIAKIMASRKKKDRMPRPA